MEIDFLGLNSNTRLQDSSSQRPHPWNNGGVETFLSLSSTSSNSHQKKKWELPSEKRVFNHPLCNEGSNHYTHGSLPMSSHPGLVLASTPVFAPPRPASFLYDLNNNHCTTSRNVPDQNSLRSFYSSHPVGNKAAYATNIGISAEARMNKRGHTPTVAMARKASLVRFLEKRLHRMNQTRAPHLMGKPLNPEANYQDKKRDDSIDINYIHL